MPGVRKERVAAADAGIRLDRWFKEHVPDLPFGRLQKLLRTGQIRVDGGRAKAAQRVEEGQEIRIPPLADKAKTAQARPHHSLGAADRRMLDEIVLYADDELLVLDKPAGLAVQGGSGSPRNLDDMLEHFSAKGKEAVRPRLVHRLDKDTSGVIVVARTRKAAQTLAGAFKSRKTRKIYWALVAGVPDPPEGEIDAPLAKLPGRAGEKMAVTAEGKPALTRYRVVDRAGTRAAWLVLQPVTGRTHQLRAHLAHIGHAIVGDGKYGGGDAMLGGEISRKLHLHARSIRIAKPSGGEIYVEATLPPHMRNSWDLLGFDPDLEAADAGFDKD